MSDKTYAQFNTMTITGRISHHEIVDGQYGEFLSVTMLTELMNDAEAITVQFNTTNGLLSLAKSGWLNNGRRVTVTGHLSAFAETYFNKKTGQREMLKRPRLTLSKAVVFEGGLGPAKREDAETAPKAGAPVVDKRPAIATTPSGSAVTDF
jgi:hypothetical protein